MSHLFITYNSCEKSSLKFALTFDILKIESHITQFSFNAKFMKKVNMFFGIVTPPMHLMSFHVDHNPCNVIHYSCMIYI
jgi:hypothetical protein